MMRNGVVVLPDLDVARARCFVDELNAEMPFDARDQVKYELDVKAGSLTILECRPPWREDYGPEWTRHDRAASTRAPSCSDSPARTRCGPEPRKRSRRLFFRYPKLSEGFLSLSALSAVFLPNHREARSASSRPSVLAVFVEPLDHRRVAMVEEQ